MSAKPRWNSMAQPFLRAIICQNYGGAAGKDGCELEENANHVGTSGSLGVDLTGRRNGEAFESIEATSIAVEWSLIITCRGPRLGGSSTLLSMATSP
ncbi:hypothetical protein GOP47_0018049 [Adiantum capillus-veneris]|uniref:Uncharacterized protein n=1 Tax=Adiantum capillus-veneris TaxID=13818 RepID=A0A9D4UGL2_ADICA|nr:hypothetical protein GOP47_0018049 [Adiantum capillus-veneris]